MKAYKWVLAALITASLVVVGCSKKESSTTLPGPQASVNTAPLEDSFKSAEPATQTSANKVVTAIKSGDYASALAELKTLASNAKLNPEQQQAVKDITVQVQQAVTQTATKAKEDVTKAVDDMKTSLPK
ncbi:MAG TPA: hypothetical protein VNT26_17550 [Candidatus Sulfotelmatobacter sp.]|nr:hypothetical protein [Candidatus Sulfotelmatobacter sp.]HWI58835.1 hypothetical protein [Bacillota bacterium]